jgi:serine/threonine protein phosphatase 1
MPRTIAIGDIHGCAAALATLVEAINPQADDTIVTLGDYVDRGPDSRAVIDQLLALERRCLLVPLLGNHEWVMLSLRDSDQALHFWLSACGGAATLASYGGRLHHIPSEHWDFFARCRRFHQTENHIFLHANYAAGLTLEEQPDELLFWTHLVRVPPPHYSGKQVIVGHTPQVTGEILDAGHLVCIDTWCFGNGCLTAYDVDTKAMWQAEKGGVLLRSPDRPA